MQLLALWEHDLTARPVEEARREVTPALRGARLDEAVSHLDHALDRAVRAWGMRVAVARVDKRRIAYLAQLHRGVGHRQPILLAQLEYAMCLGLQHLDLTPRADQRKLAREMRRPLDALIRGRRR